MPTAPYPCWSWHGRPPGVAVGSGSGTPLRCLAKGQAPGGVCWGGHPPYPHLSGSHTLTPEPRCSLCMGQHRCLGVTQEDLASARRGAGAARSHCSPLELLQVCPVPAAPVAPVQPSEHKHRARERQGCSRAGGAASAATARHRALGAAEQACNWARLIMMDNSIIFPFLMRHSLACPADAQGRVHPFQPPRAQRPRSVKASVCGALNAAPIMAVTQPCAHKRLQTAGDQLTQSTRGDPADARQGGSVLPGAWQPSRAPALAPARIAFGSGVRVPLAAGPCPAAGDLWLPSQAGPRPPARPCWHAAPASSLRPPPRALLAPRCSPWLAALGTLCTA